MSSDNQRGRADAAAAKYDPPSLILGGFFSSGKEQERMEKRVQEYREGYNDKRRELSKNDKKR